VWKYDRHPKLQQLRIGEEKSRKKKKKMKKPRIIMFASATQDGHNDLQNSASVAAT